MAEVVDEKQLILKSMLVNNDYMRLPVGQLHNYPHIIGLYKRIAQQCVEASLCWANGEACPRHEPAADAFLWAIVAWLDPLAISAGFEIGEWRRVIVQPHWHFAEYMRPGLPAEAMPPVIGSPAEIIVSLDVLFLERVVKLTSKWGLPHHIKDLPAVNEAHGLDAELKKPCSPAWLAYLESDLRFFDNFFIPYPLTARMRNDITSFLDTARTALEPYEGDDNDDE